MTPIKSVAMIKRSLEKAFVCKSHVMIMIHSKWCLLFFFSTCLLWDGPAIYLGGGGGGRRGLAKEKQNRAQEKKEKNWYTRKHAKTFMQVSPILGVCITGMLERKFSYFYFEWKVLNRHNLDLPDINQYCSHCQISVNLQ